MSFGDARGPRPSNVVAASRRCFAITQYAVGYSVHGTRSPAVYSSKEIESNKPFGDSRAKPRFRRRTMDDVKRAWREADAVMFDVDSTVATDEGIDKLAEFCGKGKEVSKITAEAMGQGLNYQESLKQRLEIMLPTLENLEEFLRRHPTTLTPGIEELVRRLHERKVQVYLVSGGFRRIIEPIRQRLNIPEENVFANRLIFNNGKYDGFDTTEPTSRDGGKAEVADLLKKRFRYKKLIMVGDGSTDADACPPADAFIGFGGNVAREKIKARSKWFVTDFKEMISELDKC